MGKVSDYGLSRHAWTPAGLPEVDGPAGRKLSDPAGTERETATDPAAADRGTPEVPAVDLPDSAAVPAAGDAGNGEDRGNTPA